MTLLPRELAVALLTTRSRDDTGVRYCLTALPLAVNSSER